MNRIFQILIQTFINPIKLWEDELEQKNNIEDFYLKKVIIYNFFIAVIYLFVNTVYLKKYQINDVNNLFSISLMLMLISTFNIAFRSAIFNMLLGIFTDNKDYFKSSMLIFFSSIPISIIFVIGNLQNMLILNILLYIYYLFLIWRGIDFFFTLKKKKHILLFIAYFIVDNFIYAILIYYKQLSQLHPILGV